MPRITVVTDNSTVVDVLDIDDEWDISSQIHRESIKEIVIAMLKRAYLMQEDGQ